MSTLVQHRTDFQGLSDQAATAIRIMTEELPIQVFMRTGIPNTCILSTSIACRIGKRLGLMFKPSPARAIVFNPVLVTKLEEWCATNKTDSPPRSVVDDFVGRDGCWNVGVGFGERVPGKYAGHVVAIVEDRALVDLTIGQANRREHGIKIPKAIVAEIDDDFVQGGALFVPINGSLVIYQQRDDKTFLSTPDWNTNTRRDSDVVEMMVKKISARIRVECRR